MSINMFGPLKIFMYIQNIDPSTFFSKCFKNFFKPHIYDDKVLFLRNMVWESHFDQPVHQIFLFCIIFYEELLSYLSPSARGNFRAYGSKKLRNNLNISCFTGDNLYVCSFRLKE